MKVNWPDCTCICCSNETEAYQPKQWDILEHNFLEKVGILCYRGIKNTFGTLCVSKKKIFSLYCRYALKHNMFSPCGVKPDAAFMTRGFQNIKKAIERFLAHESSAPHNKARMKWELKFRPTLVQQLSVESA